jgi:uncharacterized repeat protein (TIGR03803 family)
MAHLRTRNVWTRLRLATALIACAGGFVVNGLAAEAEAQTESVVHSFAGPPDGAAPYSRVVKVKGPNQRAIFYRLTANGGSGGFGTVFSLNPKTGFAHKSRYIGVLHKNSAFCT